MGPRVRVIVFIRASQLAKGKALTGRHFGGQVPEGIRGGGRKHIGKTMRIFRELVMSFARYALL